MGLSKVKKIGSGKVKVIHQLDNDGKAYAEDVTIESDVPGRLDYWEGLDGKVGVMNFSFSKYDPAPEGVKFPE